jgi:hypothetical protein
VRCSDVSYLKEISSNIIRIFSREFQRMFCAVLLNRRTAFFHLNSRRDTSSSSISYHRKLGNPEGTQERQIPQHLMAFLLENSITNHNITSAVQEVTQQGPSTVKSIENCFSGVYCHNNHKSDGTFTAVGGLGDNPSEYKRVTS